MNFTLILFGTFRSRISSWQGRIEATGDEIKKILIQNRQIQFSGGVFEVQRFEVVRGDLKKSL